MEKEKGNLMESHPYFNLPSFIEELRGERGNKESSNINFTIILLSTTIIESVLFDLLNLSLGESFNLNSISGRIKDDISKKLNRASWREYHTLTKLILNKKLNECVNNELWKSIQFLYDYRNFIVHGKPIVSYESKSDGRFEYEGPLKKILEHFTEKQISMRNRGGILTSEVADYFWSSTKTFVIEISKKLKNDENTIVFLMLKDTLKV